MQEFKGVSREGVRDRITGYSDEQMFNQINLLQGIITRTKLVKVGRGRAAHTIEQKVYNTPPEVIKEVEVSLAHYKKLMEEPRQIKFRESNKD